jgi:hypothetical protein
MIHTYGVGALIRVQTDTEIAEHAEIPYEEWIIAVKFFCEYGIWSGHLGPPPGRSGCRASVDLLERYGLDKAGRRSA